MKNIKKIAKKARKVHHILDQILDLTTHEDVSEGSYNYRKNKKSKSKSKVWYVLDNQLSTCYEEINKTVLKYLKNLGQKTLEDIIKYYSDENGRYTFEHTEETEDLDQFMYRVIDALDEVKGIPTEWI